MLRSSDTSIAESGSEAEDIASPKAILNYSHLRLTPSREEVFDSVLKKQASMPKPPVLKGIPLQSTAEVVPERLNAQIMVFFMAFFMILLTLFHSTKTRVTKKLHHVHVSSEDTQKLTRQEPGLMSTTPSFVEAEPVSFVLKRLGELENKVDTLKAKPSEMPYEKEELLNAVVCRVDSLEAELIATKKALHEAPMRQRELLPYIDGQEQRKLRINLHQTCYEEYPVLCEEHSNVWLEHLDKLEIKCFRNLKPEMEFVKFILTISPELK